MLGVGLLFGGWVGAEAESRGPARFYVGIGTDIQLLRVLLAHPLLNLARLVMGRDVMP